MIGGVEMKLSTMQPEHFLPKIAGESGISVRKNTMRHTMKLEDMIHENLSHNGGGEWVLKCMEMSILGKMIVGLTIWLI
jgi:hypothetical protein